MAELRRLSLGICCMASKATSPPMKAILRRLEICNDFVITIFPESTILNEPVEQWPVVECLIAFASSGFPLEKCKAYCARVKPTLINSVEAQDILQSRVQVYRMLGDWGIPCPDHVVIDHEAVQEGDFVENENYIMYKGKKITKPFVEKPDDGDRHDIWIYYPMSVGGGVKKLFRKVKDKSSEFDAELNTIRRDGVYVYEPFLPTHGTDIKVYTVGAGYVHAEARKAPTVDGKVQRTKDGKEVRYPVVLTQSEKAISALIVRAFQQNICGFDILRTDGGSFVCDVNGWSFVKGNQKYYNDCATVIRMRLLQERGVTGVDMRMLLGPGDEVVESSAEGMREADPDGQSQGRLRCVIVVMRHGDRRPKEKLKFKTKQPALLSYFGDVEQECREVKLKTPEEMTLLKARMEKVVEDLQAQRLARSGDKDFLDELRADLSGIELLIEVLGMQDRFSGLERKVQLKATKWKPSKEEEGRRLPSQVQVVAKWGGELTVGGLAQAEDLGRQLRLDLYPNDPTGLLRLHSSFRHDFKIYSSQEGRCQITAAAFTKGFLALEGDITPILVSLVTSDSYTQALLDEPIPKKKRDAVKQKIESLLLSIREINSDDMIKLSCPTSHSGLREAANRIKNPLGLLHKVRHLSAQYIDSIVAAKEAAYQEMRQHQALSSPETQDLELSENTHEEAHDDAVPLGAAVPQGPGVLIPLDLQDTYKRQWLHLKRKEHRWRKLFHGFVQLKDDAPSNADSDDNSYTYDTSKIPDVWDNLYYDMLTHRNYLGDVSCRIAESMVVLLQPLSEWVSLSEYGISQEEKLRIGTEVTWRLIGKILGDLEFMIDAEVGQLDEAGLPRNKDDLDGQESVASGEIAAMSQISNGDPAPAATAGGTGGYSSPGTPGKEPDPAGSASTQAGSTSDTKPKPSWQEWTGGPGPCGSDPGSSGPASPSQCARGGFARTDPIETSVPFRRVRSVDIPVEKEVKDKSGTSGSPSQESQQGQRSAALSSAPVNPKETSKKTKLSRLTPALRNKLKHALRDSSDWHPRLNEEVAKLTDIKNTCIVRSRIYVTSASTMHSLLNILRHGQCADGDQAIVSDLGDVIDLNYLTHIVFRCYEQDGPAPGQPREKGTASTSHPQQGSDDAFGGGPPVEAMREREKDRYRVEIAMSPGVQVVKGGSVLPWPDGSELREENCVVAPLKIIASSVELGRIERFMMEVVKEYGGHSQDEEDEDDDKGSDG